MNRLLKYILCLLAIPALTVNIVFSQPKERPRKCIMVFGAHADDVEPMAGGTFAKYISEGYEGIYVCVINNFAGCGIESVGGATTPPPEVKSPLFTVSDSPQSYPVDALETIQIRAAEAREAAAVFHSTPVFLDFRTDVKKYLDVKYEALNKHVSQKGTIRKQTRPEEVTEEFITALDNTK
jgi:LmbE family N-acetylglucosaminyl deacetylase